jgi:hypothetical protein
MTVSEDHHQGSYAWGGGAGPSQDCRGDDEATQSSATGQTSSHYRSDQFS